MAYRKGGWVTAARADAHADLPASCDETGEFVFCVEHSKWATWNGSAWNETWTTSGGAHPDLATHDTLGLATQAELDAHAAADDPHAGYVREADANWTDLTDAGETTLHSHAGGSHPDLAAHDALGLATQTELDTHAGAADPHTGYRLESAAITDTDVAAANKDGAAGTASMRTIGAGAQQSSAGNHTHGGASISTLKKTADQIINGTAFQDITDLTFAVSANTDYAFDFYITFRSTTTTGFRFSVNGPAGVVDFMRKYQTIANSDLVGVATWLEGHAVSFNTMTVTTATIAAGVDLHCRITGRFKCGGSGGTFACRVASESANNDLVVQKGSWGIWF